MRLMDELRHQHANEQSYFQQHLLTEDINRLQRLKELAAANDDTEAFVKEGMMIGWTPNDLRTHELGETIKPLLAAIHDRSRASGESAELAKLDDRISALWEAFNAHRMERLIGCLSRVPALPDAADT